MKGAVSTALEYTDNAKQTKHDTRSDMASITTAGIAAESDWDRHAFGLGVVASLTRFFKETSENKNAIRLFASGRVDVNDVTNIATNVHYVRNTEDRNNPQEARVNLSELRDYDDVGGDVSLNYNAGLLKLSALSGFNHITYDTQDGETLGFRDRNVYRYSTRIAYPLSDLVDVYIQPSYTSEIYAQKLDANGIKRDSRLYQIYGGVVYQVTDVTMLDFAIGQIKRQFDDARLNDRTGLGFDVALDWQPLDTLTVSASLNRTIESTTLGGVNDIIVTGGRIMPTYSFTDQLSASAEFAYNEYTFSGTPLTDTDYLTGVGLQYAWFNGVNTGGRYRYRERTSDRLDRDFTNNTILFFLSSNL